MELRMEIESLKLAETDPARKGNSLFAEVEDHRQAMERQLVNYKTNYNILKKQTEFKVQQVANLKVSHVFFMFGVKITRKQGIQCLGFILLSKI